MFGCGVVLRLLFMHGVLRLAGEVVRSGDTGADDADDGGRDQPVGRRIHRTDELGGTLGGEFLDHPAFEVGEVRLPDDDDAVGGQCVSGSGVVLRSESGRIQGSAGERCVHRGDRV